MQTDYNKRYWLYVIVDYYPSGGVHDLEGTYDTIEESEAYYNKYADVDGYEVSIWDMEERTVIKQNT